MSSSTLTAPEDVVFHELVGAHDRGYEQLWYSPNTWKARLVLLSVKEAHPNFSFSIKTHTWPEIRGTLEKESGIKGITVPTISVNASPEVHGEALRDAGFTENSGQFWLCDSEKIARWCEKAYGIPACFPSEEPFRPVRLHKTFLILLPDLDAFVPPGDAHDYLIKAKFGPPPAWENFAKSGRTPEAMIAAIESFDWIESRLASQPYLGGASPSFEDFQLFGYFATYYLWSSLNIGRARELYQRFWTGGDKYAQLLEWRQRMWNGWGGEPGRTLEQGVAVALAQGKFDI